MGRTGVTEVDILSLLLSETGFPIDPPNLLNFLNFVNLIEDRVSFVIHESIITIIIVGTHKLEKPPFLTWTVSYRRK